MSIKKLTLREHIQIQKSMSRDFHRAEIKPFWMILRMKLQGRYCGYGYYEDNRRVGYMLLCTDGKQNGWTLLDYYAIEPDCRSKGYGSTFFQEACSHIPKLLLEVEDPAFSLDESDKKKRLRRIAFYDRNNCQITPVRANVFGERYCIFTGPGTELPPEGLQKEAVMGMYRAIFGKRLTDKHIFVGKEA